jgi:hypothetical protein
LQKVTPAAAKKMTHGTKQAGWPDWANIRPMGDCLVWGSVSNVTEVASSFFGYFFGCKCCVFILTKMGWATLWTIF